MIISDELCFEACLLKNFTNLHLESNIIVRGLHIHIILPHKLDFVRFLYIRKSGLAKGFKRSDLLKIRAHILMNLLKIVLGFFLNFKRVLGIPKIMKTFEKPVPKSQLRINSYARLKK
ncbi:hypothetical protein ACJX0J_007776, partial [Zea mays]